MRATTLIAALSLTITALAAPLNWNDFEFDEFVKAHPELGKREPTPAPAPVAIAAREAAPAPLDFETWQFEEFVKNYNQQNQKREASPEPQPIEDFEQWKANYEFEQFIKSLGKRDTSLFEAYVQGHKAD